MWNVGDRIGNYQIVADLRPGGMATLFLATRVGVAGFARHVAIKVIHPHLAQDRTFVRMFIDEALLSARIDHPNVVHVQELGEVEGTYFLVMEYVQGSSLAQMLSALSRMRRKLSPELAVAIAAQVAEGLHAAHETRGADGELLGVVHRDVSPQNILLSFRGQVKLIDFGIAKASNRPQSSKHTIRGKFQYMAPEQALGEAVDRRTDVYALGIVLWEMLTARRLFTANGPTDLLQQVRYPRIVPPSRYAPGLDAALDALVLDALAPDPARRIPTALEFRRRLIEALPAAMMLGSAELAELLGTVMADQIQAVQRQLPAAVWDVPTVDQQRGARGAAQVADGGGRTETHSVLETLTVATHDATTDVEDTSGNSAYDLPSIAIDPGHSVSRTGSRSWRAHARWLGAAGLAAAVATLLAVRLVGPSPARPAANRSASAVDAGVRRGGAPAQAHPSSGGPLADLRPRAAQTVADAGPVAAGAERSRTDAGNLRQSARPANGFHARPSHSHRRRATSAGRRVHDGVPIIVDPGI